MATSTTCPSCGQPITLPAGYAGGPVACPNPACGQTFSANGAASGPKAGGSAATGPMNARLAPRPPGSRPELLDRIEPNFWISPPMLSVGGVMVLLYGMVLFGVVTAWKNRPAPPLPPESYALAPIAPAPPPEPPGAEKSKPQSPGPTSTPTPPRPPEADKAKAAPIPESPTPSKTEPPKNEPPKTEVARVTPKPAPPPSPPAPPPAPKGETWGPLVGFTGDTLFRPDGTGLSLIIPPSLHILSSDLGLKNAPRLLADVRGDFTAQVTIPGRILPGTQPLPDFPFTFQGAGLIVWQDENNYLRLERASVFFVENSKRVHQVLLEYCRDGKTSLPTLRDAKDADITVRMVRTGSEVRCSYSSDGRDWPEVKRQNVAFPANVQVGISASNASTKSFGARFEGFKLIAGGGGSKAGRGQ